MTTLVVDRVTVGYGGRSAPALRDVVLRDVSVTVSPGSMLAVTGPSGAGKTTLLWTMAGLLQPVEGGVLLDGVSLRDRDHAAAQRVVLVPQDNGLAPILTADENLQVALLATGSPPPEARRAGRPAGGGAVRRSATAHRYRPGAGAAGGGAASGRGHQRTGRGQP